MSPGSGGTFAQPPRGIPYVVSAPAPLLQASGLDDWDRITDPTILRIAGNQLFLKGALQEVAVAVLSHAGLRIIHATIETTRLSKECIIRFNGGDRKASILVRQTLAGQKVSNTEWATDFFKTADGATAHVYVSPDKVRKKHIRIDIGFTTLQLHVVSQIQMGPWPLSPSLPPMKSNSCGRKCLPPSLDLPARRWINF